MGLGWRPGDTGRSQVGGATGHVCSETERAKGGVAGPVGGWVLTGIGNVKEGEPG